MSDNVFPIKELQERLDYLKNNPRKLGKIKNINLCITEFIQTDKGRECIKDYIIQQDAFNYELIEEIKNYKQKL